MILRAGRASGASRASRVLAARLAARLALAMLWLGGTATLFLLLDLYT
ncbi:MAG: hypothetical protein ABW046_21190 [Actinoplanes sp.]